MIRSRFIHLSVVAIAVLALVGIVGAGQAEAGSPQTFTRTELSGTTFLNPCVGEMMTITDGTFQLITRFSNDANGGLHIGIRGNAQGVVAIGAVSGLMYRFAGDFWAEQNIAVDGFPATIQQVEVHNVLSQGAADNLIVHVVVHLTLSANGEVRSSVDSLRADCRG